MSSFGAGNASLTTASLGSVADRAKSPLVTNHADPLLTIFGQVVLLPTLEAHAVIKVHRWVGALQLLAPSLAAAAAVAATDAAAWWPSF